MAYPKLVFSYLYPVFLRCLVDSFLDRFYFRRTVFSGIVWLVDVAVRRPNAGFGIERVLLIHRVGKRYIAVLTFSFFGIDIFPFSDLSWLAGHDGFLMVYR
jgi:hypothetical protein